MSQQFLYRVWAPDTAPTTSEPLLTLHDEKAVRFFVQTVLDGNLLFLNKSFAMVAYHVRSQLLERVVAEGTYRLQVEEYPRLYTVYEAGMLADYGGCGVISAAIIDAIAAITKGPQEQIL